MIEDIFIPDTGYLQDRITVFTAELEEKFGFDASFFNQLFQDEAVIEDIYEDYNISGVGNFHLKFFDTKSIIQAVDFFRPYIRGFLVFLLALFNIKQILGFIRQDAGVVTGKTVKIGRDD